MGFSSNLEKKEIPLTTESTTQSKKLNKGGGGGWGRDDKAHNVFLIHRVKPSFFMQLHVHFHASGTMDSQTGSITCLFYYLLRNVTPIGKPITNLTKNKRQAKKPDSPFSCSIVHFAFTPGIA